MENITSHLRWRVAPLGGDPRALSLATGTDFVSLSLPLATKMLSALAMTAGLRFASQRRQRPSNSSMGVNADGETVLRDVENRGNRRLLD